MARSVRRPWRIPRRRLLMKAEAAKHIERLQKRTGRGQ